MDTTSYDDAYNALYAEEGGGDGGSWFNDFLKAGVSVGAAYASQELFGSQNANAAQLAAERQQWNRQNGSGVVNWQSALKAPLDELSYLYGNPAARAQGQTPAPAAAGVSGGTLAMIVGIIILVLLLIFRR